MRSSIGQRAVAPSRRTVLQLVLGGAVGAVLPACQRTPKEQRDQVFSALVEQLVVPDMQALLTKSRGLESALTRLVRAPNASALAASRTAFGQALLAWEAAACFKSGPILATGALLRVLFWPTRTPAVDGLIRSHAALDQLSALPVDQKGLFAIEHLLFPLDREGGAAEARLTGPEGERTRWLLCGLSRLVTESAHQAQATLGDGTRFRSSLIEGGHDSIKLVLNNIGATVSSVITDPGAVLRNEVQRAAAGVRGGVSGLAFAIAECRIAAAQRLYRGDSERLLGALVKDNAPEVHAEVESDFAKALAEVRALPQRLAPDRAPPSVRRAAADAVHVLEAVVKSELATALGVPLLFGLPHED